MNTDSTAIKDGPTVLERATWITRWFAIVIYATTFPYTTANRLSSISIIVAGIIYNLVRYAIKIETRPRLRSPIIILAIDYIFLTWLLYLTGGIWSPYVFFISMPVLVTAYIRRSTGLTPMIVLLGTSGIVLFLTTTYHSSQVIEFGPFRATAIVLMIFCITAYMADRLTESERIERNYALSLQYLAEAERSRLTTLINSIAEVVLAIDARGIITLFNAAALNMLGVHDLKGKSVAEILPVINEHNDPVNLIQVAKNNPSITQRNDLRYKNPNDNTLASLDISIAPVKTPFKDRSGNNSAYIMVIRDITKAKDLEEQRDEFLSVITHELRTPIATAEAGISVLLTPKISQLNPELIRYATLAHNSVIFLAELLNDLASISKLERGSYNIEPEPLNMREIMETVVRESQVAAQGKGLQLIIDPIPQLPAILSSRHEVKEIISNLVTNAIKYTQSGSVSLAVKVAEKKEDGIIFSITDTGIGIAATDKPHLFEKFYRSEDYRTRTAGGTGLGLYIVKKLAERLNAKIWFESKLNQGSTFYLQIPPVSKLETDKKKVIDAQMDTIITTI